MFVFIHTDTCAFVGLCVCVCVSFLKSSACDHSQKVVSERAVNELRAFLFATHRWSLSTRTTCGPDGGRASIKTRMIRATLSGLGAEGL